MLETLTNKERETFAKDIFQILSFNILNIKSLENLYDHYNTNYQVINMCKDLYPEGYENMMKLFRKRKSDLIVK
tara:strand:- start:56 stop:277 length:222 start_codon:yes stop_codon:yes gene_type:complete